MRLDLRIEHYIELLHWLRRRRHLPIRRPRFEEDRLLLYENFAGIGHRIHV